MNAKQMTLLLTTLLLLLWGTTAVAPVHAATITVTNLDDSGPGSLRETIADAASGDTIDFNVSGTITLTSQLVIDKNLTIDGGGQITVSGNNATRIFNVTAGNVTFNNLTIANGNVTTTDCGPFGLRCGGGIILQNSGVVVTVNNSVLSGNSAAFGGGILNYEGTLTVINSTLSGNSATNQGGGIYSLTANGNCMSTPWTIIRHSTISGNSAPNGGGIRNNNGVTEITHSTITANTASNGGGVWSANNSATCTRVGQTIIAGNSNNDVAAANSPNPLYYSLDYNLIGVAGNNVDFSLEFNQPGDMISAPLLLGPLADNGGPTLTHMPRIDSPAVGGGNCATGPATDQRGQNRPQDASCDIGAVEVQNGEDEWQVCGLTEGGVYHFRATGVQIEIEGLGNLQCLDINITNAPHSAATTGLPAPYVTITTIPAIASGYQVRMTLLHAGFDDPQICKYPGESGGAGWECARDGFDGSRVWLGGIEGFSDWAVGDEVSPTAVSNLHIQTTSPSHLPLIPLLATVLTLLTSAWLWLTRSSTFSKS